MFRILESATRVSAICAADVDSDGNMLRVVNERGSGIPEHGYDFRRAPLAGLPQHHRG